MFALWSFLFFVGLVIMSAIAVTFFDGHMDSKIVFLGSLLISLLPIIIAGLNKTIKLIYCIGENWGIDREDKKKDV